MKILLASDKFKGSLSAREACEAMRQGVLRFDPGADTILCPLADGGEGTLDVLAEHRSLKAQKVTVRDPLFRPVSAYYLRDSDTAYIEMAQASGLQLLSELERNCLYTSSFGTGELILHALKQGVESVYLFVGGSATNDAGMGMAAALGVRFLDEQGKELKPIGENLIKVHQIDQSQLLVHPAGFQLTIVTDVQNVLFGDQGAAKVYAPQKGADKGAVELLDKGLRHFSQQLKKHLGKEVSSIPGSGAAGGMAAGAVAFFNASIQNGIQWMVDWTGLEKQLHGVDLVLTGEGKLDAQTSQGKVIAGLAVVCRKHQIPLVAICGLIQVSEKELNEMGLHDSRSLVSDEIDPEQAMQSASSLLTRRTFELLLSLNICSR